MYPVNPVAVSLRRARRGSTEDISNEVHSDVELAASYTYGRRRRRRRR